MGKPSVVVLGGGIIGALAAYELANNGAEVVLLEKNKFNQGASGNTAAMLEYQLDAHRGEPFLSLARASHDQFPSLYQELQNLTGIDFDFERCGILQVALTQKEADVLKLDVEENRRRSLRVEWLSPAEVKKVQPEMAAVTFGGAFFQDDGQVDGGKFLEAALAAARKKGAALHDNCGETKLMVEEDRVMGVTTKIGAFKGSHMVVAAGAYADQIFSQLGIQLGVQPIRGQLVVYKTDRKILAVPIYTASGGYLTPKKGTTLAGTTVESVGFDTRSTAEGRQTIIEQIVKLFPAFAGLPIQGMKVGLRPKSPDDLPLLGPLPGYPNVVSATGHYRNGILLAPVTAKLISHFILGTPAPVDPSPFLPSRVWAPS